MGYVLTRSSGAKYGEVYRQMDGYVLHPHLFGVSLQSGSAGCHFWQEQFVKTVQDWLAEGSNTKEKTDAGKAERD